MEYPSNAAFDRGLPVNVGILGKGNSYGRGPLLEQAIAGVVGYKVHEDWGATANALRHALRMADEVDIQVSVHTDSLNECGYVEDTIDAFEGRTIHTFHTEGAGGAMRRILFGWPVRLTYCQVQPTQPCRTVLTVRLSCLT